MNYYLKVTEEMGRGLYAADVKVDTTKYSVNLM